MGMFSSQQNTPLNPRSSATPLNGPGQPSPMMAPMGNEPVSTPLPQQPLESQGLPTGQIPGGQMPGGQAGEMATPEQRQELLDLLDATREKMSELQTAKFRSGNERGVARIETLKEIFMMMQGAGVDLADPASVGAFLTRLEQVSPEMSQLFEETLNDLLGEEGGQETGMQEMQEGSPLPPNEALSQNLRGPISPEVGNTPQ